MIRIIGTVFLSLGIVSGSTFAETAAIVCKNDINQLTISYKNDAKTTYSINDSTPQFFSQVLVQDVENGSIFEFSTENPERSARIFATDYNANKSGLYQGIADINLDIFRASLVYCIISLDATQ